MRVLQSPTRKRLVCPTTGYHVYTKEIVVYPFWEGEGMAVIWWFCTHCDDWHLLLITPVPLPPQPLMPISLNWPFKTNPKKPYRLSAQDTMSVDFTGRTFFLSYRFSNQIQTIFCYPVDSSTFFHEKPGIISSVVCRPPPWLFFLPYSTMSLADIGQCFLQ